MRPATTRSAGSSQATVAGLTRQPSLGASDPVHVISAGGATGDLHHERDRGPQCQLRKAIKTKGHFPNEDAARRLLYLAIANAVPAWTKTRNWTAALLAFKIHFGDRLPD